MEEEKKKKKPKELNSFEYEEKKISSLISSKPENKKSYKVVIVTLAKVIYSFGDGLGNGITPNIWGMQLKPGDEIYI